MGELIPVVLTHFVAFMMFIWVIKRYGVVPVMRVLDERRERIAHQFDEIDQSEKRAVALREEYEEKLREIDEEARKRVQSELTRGRRISEEIVEKAREEASALIEKAQANALIQMEKARAELKDEIVALTLQATERLLKEQLDQNEQKRLVGAFLDEIAKPETN